MSHLGPRVSALLDGRLSPAEEERCWSHVHECHACRDLVEREGWVKTQLAGLSFGCATTPASLKANLRQPGLLSEGSLTPPRGGARSGWPRARGLVAIGGGAAGACVVGVLALGVTGGPRVEPRPPVTDLSRPTSPATPAAPAGDLRRRTSPSPAPTSPLTAQLVAVRERMGS